ncbi:cytochrome P450 [Mycena maculata]|uniref:Cytochrome P450 n=1 Tax=Mycena maculata TaxID=230809 RepID=A0AAD7I9G0_9AGAR|nr:cytochrome P450 [Mycena maculata]
MSPIVLLVVALCTVLIFHIKRKGISTQRTPPGPIGLPLVGNLLHVPLKHPWIKFQRLGETYGDMTYFHGLGNSILVLNNHGTMLDLLVKKGNLYCSRPYFTVACELMNLVNSTAFAPFGERWRLHRKLARVALGPEALREYDSTLMDISAILNRSLAESPADFINDVRLAAGRVIMSTMYGISVDSAQDPYIVRAEAAMNMISKATIPGEFTVDLLPALKHLPTWFPLTRFHTVGEEGRKMIEELVAKPYQYVKDEMAAGSSVPSFTRDALTKKELQTERDTDETFEHAVKWAAASMYAAGQEVISSSVLNMIMALALHPEILRTAQAEIDSVVGRQRPPSIKDRHALPYILAIVKETLRWHPPLPMDIPRASIEDDFYNGYLIPKNTTVIPNIWSLSRAPDPDYPPENFSPERFLDNSRINKPLSPLEYCFGFGRRICPGRGLAENSIFLLAASIISSFDITPAVDGKGIKIPIDVQYSSGLVSLPEDFKCSIKPRGGTAISVDDDRQA